MLAAVVSDAERTEKPTPHKLRRARERGEVPQSPLLGAALALGGVTAALWATGPSALAAWLGFAERTLSLSRLEPAAALAAAADVAASALFWPLLAAVVLGALASFLQVGPLFTAVPLAPDPSRLSPARGLGRMLSASELAPRAGGVALGLSFLLVAALVLRDALPGLFGATGAGFALGAGVRVLRAFLLRALLLLSAAALVGVVYRRVRFLREQRMTRRELRKEQRETEGEPLAKRRRAELHRERALGPGVEEALEGAAVVVRGAGRAVVLRFRADSDEPPVVTLSARGPLVSRVLGLAARRGVPSVDDETLAAALDRGRPLARAELRRLARHLARVTRRDG